jgi:hypothetical protein
MAADMGSHIDHLEDSKARLASVLVLPLSRHVPLGPAEQVQE